MKQSQDSSESCQAMLPGAADVAEPAFDQYGDPITLDVRDPRVQHAALRIQAHTRRWLAQRRFERRKRDGDERRFQNKLARIRERLEVRLSERIHIERLGAQEYLTYHTSRTHAAGTIQRYWRGHRARCAYRALPAHASRQQAAELIQSRYRTWVARKQASAPTTRIGGATSPRPTSRASSPASRASSPFLGPDAQDEGGSCMTREGIVVDPERRQALLAQVRSKADWAGAHRNAPPLAELQSRADALLASHHAEVHTRHDTLARAASARQRAAMAYSRLSASSALPSELPVDTDPNNFPRAPRDSLRMELALQAHAMAKVDVADAADVEATDGKWWKPFAQLNQMSVAECGAVSERRMQVDRLRRRNWEAITRTELARPWPVEQPCGAAVSVDVL